MQNNENLSIEEFDDRAILNNIKHFKNNLSTFKNCTSMGDNYQAVVATPSIGIASLLEGQEEEIEDLSSTETLPWKYARFDLFDNSKIQDLKKNKQKLNLKISFLINGKFQYLSAALNSDFRFFKRGFDTDIADDLAHIDAVTQAYQTLCETHDRVRASKCYTNNSNFKGQSQYGISVVVGRHRQTEQYTVVLVDGTEYHGVNLSNKGIKKTQRDAGIIAQATLDTNYVKPPRQTRKDFWGKK
jgi:hypothetical protein